MPDTFTPAYAHPYSSIARPNIIVTSMRGGGRKYRNLGGTYQEISFSLDGMTNAQAAYVNTFYNEHHVTLEAFNFYCPLEADTFLVIFDPETPLNITLVDHNKWSGTCKLIEVPA